MILVTVRLPDDVDYFTFMEMVQAVGGNTLGSRIEDENA